MRWGIGLMVFVSMTALASADTYDRQIQMTATLLGSDADGFAKACLRLEGTLTEGEEISKCERGQSLYAIKHENDFVTWAMIAYPSTPENIEGLWQQAQKTFGKPDVVSDKELVWHLARGAKASAGFDPQYSTFVLAREPTP